MKKVLVIGAGASGLASAYSFAKSGYEVTVLEKNEKAGRKIYITGKGRCNITNDCTVTDFLKNVVRNNKFLYSSLNAFSPQNTIDFFNKNGCELKTERGNRVFPVSDKSADIIDTLVKSCKSEGVNFVFSAKVTGVKVNDDETFTVSTKNKSYSSDKLVIATGGKTYPLTGSTGDGYAFAKSLSHTVTPLYPSLTGFDTKENYDDVCGLTLKNVSLKVFNGNGKKLFDEQGEISFTDRGIAGPLFVKASAYFCRENLNDLRFVADLKPALDETVLTNRFLREFDKMKNRTLKECLYTMLPKEFIPRFLKTAQVKGTRSVAEINEETLIKLVKTMKSFPIDVVSLRPFDEAIVTSGGVDVKEINPKTMESKKIKGLYFVGEILDVDALTGGFNLQIALSTGMASGRKYD